MSIVTLLGVLYAIACVLAVVGALVITAACIFLVLAAAEMLQR